MSWQGNHEIRQARYTPVEGEPQVMWPVRGFRADIFGGHGVDCLGSRHDVLARDNPAWAEAVLAAAVAAGMPLVAAQTGKAGKYRFWRLCATSPAQAEADGQRLRAERDTAQASAEAQAMRQYHALPEGAQLVDRDGEVIPALGAKLACRGYYGSNQAMLLPCGNIVPVPEGAALQDQHGWERLDQVSQARKSTWLPAAALGHTPGATAQEWADLLDAADQAAAQALAQRIEAGQAAKAAAKAAKAAKEAA